MNNTINLTIENISSADNKFLKIFYQEINELDEKLVSIINSKNLKIILTNKLSDIVSSDTWDGEKYQDYHPIDRDITTRGLCSDTINAICIFSNTVTTQNIGAILYHEIGHLIDCFDNWKKEDFPPSLSNNKEFIKMYNFCITKNWDKIKNDNRFRLKHYIQNSTPKNASKFALCETFAHCFARINNKIDDIDILGEYFAELLPIANKIYSNFFSDLFYKISDQKKFN